MIKSEQRVLQAVTDNPYCKAETVAKETGESLPNVYRILRKLRDEGHVSDGGRKRNVRWRVMGSGDGGYQPEGNPEGESEGEGNTESEGEGNTESEGESEAEGEGEGEVECESESESNADDSFIPKHPAYDKLKAYIAANSVVCLVGPAGSGKTFSTRQIAEELGYAFFLVTPVADGFELEGYLDAHGQAVSTPLREWALHKGPALLLLDEVDANNANVMLRLNALLANGMINLPGHGLVTISEDKAIVANANTWLSGADMEYVGRNQLDAAFVDRFHFLVQWDIDEPTEKAIAIYEFGKKAIPLVEKCQKIRRNLQESGIDKMFSPRRTYAVCKGVLEGRLPFKVVVEDSVLGGLDEDDKKRALRGI